MCITASWDTHGFGEIERTCDNMSLETATNPGQSLHQGDLFAVVGEGG